MAALSPQPSCSESVQHVNLNKGIRLPTIDDHSSERQSDGHISGNDLEGFLLSAPNHSPCTNHIRRIRGWGIAQVMIRYRAIVAVILKQSTIMWNN